MVILLAYAVLMLIVISVILYLSYQDLKHHE